MPRFPYHFLVSSALLMAPACLVLAGCMSDEPGGLLASVQPAPQIASSTSTVIAATFQPPAQAPLPVARRDRGSE